MPHATHTPERTTDEDLRRREDALDDRPASPPRATEADAAPDGDGRLHHRGDGDRHREPGGDGRAGVERPYDPAPATPAHTAAPRDVDENGFHAFSDDEGRRYRERWESIQASFIDEPRESVREAEGLVGEMADRLVEWFHQRQQDLEGRWDRGDEVSTEELRQTLKSYRSVFGRLHQL